MHHKLDKFEQKENRLQREVKDMTRTIKDVKVVEDDLIKKENQLEKKVSEHGDWGADEVDQHPLMPHFGPPRDLKEKLHELGERIHNKVMNLRNELFGKEHDHKEHNKNKPEKDEEPHIHVIRMHAPPFFPGFLNFNDDD